MGEKGLEPRITRIARMKTGVALAGHAVKEFDNEFARFSGRAFATGFSRW